MATAKMMYVVSGLVYAFIMIFINIGVPFLVSEHLKETQDLAITFTIIYIYYIISTVAMNAFNCYIFYKNSQTVDEHQQQQCNYLLIAMCCSDILTPLFIYPISVVFIWFVVKEISWRTHSRMLYDLYHAIRWMWALTFSTYTFSILSVAAMFLIHLAQMVRRNYTVSIWVRIISVLIPAIISVVSVFFEHMADLHKWIHVVAPFLSGYLPLFVMFSVLIAVAVLSRFPRFNEWKSKRLPLMVALYVTYLVLWLPYCIFFTYIFNADMVDMDWIEVRKYSFVLNKILLLKLSLNFFIFNIFDERFQGRCTGILLRGFSCLTSSIRFSNLETTIRFSADDEETLINS